MAALSSSSSNLQLFALIFYNILILMQLFLKMLQVSTYYSKCESQLRHRMTAIHLNILQFSSITKINWFMLFRYIIDVHSEIHTIPYNLFLKWSVTESLNKWYIYLPPCFKRVKIILKFIHIWNKIQSLRNSK